MELKWEEPRPVRTEIGFMHDDIVAELKKKPGQWAVIMENSAASHAHAINSGEKAAYRPAGTFEAAARSNGRGVGEHTIYVRYVGEGNSKSQAKRNTKYRTHGRNNGS